ncbi:hypothetical protein KIL84_016717, partial [Mauremys mutica]
QQAGIIAYRGPSPHFCVMSCKEFCNPSLTWTREPDPEDLWAQCLRGQCFHPPLPRQPQ